MNSATKPPIEPRESVAAADARRRALGDFIRTHRQRLRADAALPGSSRRRTPGLRREEVAQRAGLSVTWYTWMEQGRDVSASPSALDRLAVALGLSAAERAYLFELAGRRDPRRDQDGAAAGLPPGLHEAVAAIAAPAYVLDRAWDVRAWNSEAARLFGPWLNTEERPNLLRFIFLDPAARTLIPDWPHRARRVTAEFRADCSAHLDDPPIRALIAGLCRDSRDFAQFWEEHAVLGREGSERSFAHPVSGMTSYRQVAFGMIGHPSLKLVMLTPVGSPASKAPARK